MKSTQSAVGVEAVVRPRVTVKDLLATMSQHHAWKQECPICGQDCNKTALVKVIYKFEECDCPLADYTHLVQTLYHDACYSKREAV